MRSPPSSAPSSFHVDAMDTAALQAFVDAAARGARRPRLRLVERRRADRRDRSSSASPEDFDRSFAINVRAHAVVCGAAVPHLRAAGGGAICITASNSALLSEPKIAPYAVTKAAALALARQVARDYGGEGIRVNALCPGWIDTPFNTPAWENFGGRERFLAEVPRLVPLGRIGTRRGGGAAGLLPALGRRLVHDRPRARRRRRRVACRVESSALRCYAHDGFAYPLPDGHRFPLGKYALLRARVADDPRFEVHDARAATRDGAPARAHGRLGRARRARRRSRATSSGRSGCPGRPSWSSAPGARSARRSRPPTPRSPTAPGANLGGGTHHAFPRRRARLLRLQRRRGGDARACASAGRLRRVLVVDLDVHQGDGTHAAFAERRRGVHVRAQRPRQLPVPARARRPRARSARRARATTPTSTRSRRCSRRRSRGRAPSCASTWRAPIRSRATASGGWR